MRKRRRKMKKSFWSGIAMGGLSVFCLFHILVFRTVFGQPQKRWKRQKYDCALVCGCPANLNGSPSATMKSRVEKAVALWREGKVGRLFFTGGCVKNPHIESEVMKEYAMALGVPKEHIVTEGQSVSTYHNMMHSKQIMEDNGLNNCVVVTNKWHLRKAGHYAEKFGLDHVMCGAGEPQNASLMKTLWRYLSINLHMYVNFYRGLS